MRDFILAVDPGKLNGWAVWTPEHDVPQWGQDSQMEFCARADRWLLKTGTTARVVVERFTVTAATAKKAPHTEAIEVIGCLRWLALRHGQGDIILQQPADAKRFATNERLAALGWLPPAKMDHAQDGVRHLLLYLVNNGWRDERLLLE